MIKVDIFSGFLGAGKTTLIKKLIEEAYKGEKLVLIENEFGDIGIDGGFLKDSGIQVNEMNSGCICCTLVGDFTESLNKVAKEYSPDRIIIEPSGVGKLSDVITAVKNADNEKFLLNGFTTVVDAKKTKMYMKNFGEFFNDQVENASTIILSHTNNLKEEKKIECVNLLREKNQMASIITTDWDKLNGKQILETMENKNTVKAELEHLAKENHRHSEEHDGHHHGHHHEHSEGHCCGNEDKEKGSCKGGHGKGHHKHKGNKCNHEHNEYHEHNEHSEGHCCGHEHSDEHKEHHHGDCKGHKHSEHEHHHHHGEHCGAGCNHDHHDHHHADEIFDSIGFETIKKYSKQELENILEELEDERKYGIILRCKGIVESNEENWLHFDYIPEEPDVRDGSAEPTGMICVIGTGLNEENLRELFLKN